MLIYGHDEEIAGWVANQVPHLINGFEECISIGYLSGERLIAGFVYHDYHKAFGTIQLSMAAISPMWARWSVISEVLRYPFEQLETYKVFTAIPVDNAKAIKVNVHIGFIQEAILAHQFGKKRHAVIMRMLAPDYRRLFGESNGQRRTRPPRPGSH